MSPDQILKKCGAVLYDLEIIAAIPQQGEPRDPDLIYCGGWQDYEGMGISVVSLYDFVDCAYRIFLQDNMDDLVTLFNSRDVICGFNSMRFDNSVMRANGIEIPDAKSYDLWKEIVNTQMQGQRAGFSLEKMLIANGLPGKTGLGSNAPKQAQTGQWGRLINYCQSDTRKQVQLLRLACNGCMKSPKNGQYMTVRMPWEAVKVDTGGLF